MIAKVSNNLGRRHQTDERFRLAFEAAPNAVVMADHKGYCPGELSDRKAFMTARNFSGNL
jgi:hypothetical protein